MATLPTAVSLVLDFVFPFVTRLIQGLPSNQRPQFLAEVLPLINEMIKEANDKHLGHLPFSFRAPYEAAMEDIYSALEGKP